MTEPKVSIVIITKDRREDLAKALASIRQVRYPKEKIEIVVVEEADRPDPIPEVHYVFLPRDDKGFGFARNRGVKESSGDVIVFVDDDCIVAENWLGELTAPFEDPEVGGVTGAVCVKDCNAIGYCENVLGFPNGGLKRILQADGKIVKTQDLSTCNCGYRREVFEKAGYFLEEGVQCGGEDFELARRVSRHFSCKFNPKSVVYHKTRGDFRKIFRWFFRRGISDMTLIPHLECPNYHRFLRFWNSITLRVLAVLVLLGLLGWLHLGALFIFSVLYYGVLLSRYAFQWKVLKRYDVFFLTPFVKMVMDAGLEAGHLYYAFNKIREGLRKRKPSGEKPKILFLDQPLEPPGGGQYSLLTILENLNSRFDRRVFIPFACSYQKLLESRGIPVSVVPHAQLWKEVRKWNPDLIHCNSATTRYAFVAGVVAKILRIPFLWHVRVVESGDWKDDVLGYLSKRIIVVSEAVKHKFHTMPDMKFRKIHNAVDTEKFKPDPKPETPEIIKEPVIGFFSRIEASKGVELLLDTVKLVREKIPAVKLLVIGKIDEGYRAQFLKLLDERKLTDRVMKQDYQADIASWMKKCTVVVNPSVTPESFGRTIIEAMACGIPVVATNIGGPTEIIANGKDGFLVPLSAQPFAEVIIRLLEGDELRQRIVRKARQKVEEQYSISGQMQEVENLYKEYLSPRIG